MIAKFLKHFDNAPEWEFLGIILILSAIFSVVIGVTVKVLF